MNHWHPDLMVAERRLADLRASAERRRVAGSARPRRNPLSLRIHLDLRLTLGRSMSKEVSQ